VSEEPDDRLDRLANLTKRLAVLEREIGDLAAARWEIVLALSEDGYPSSRIAPVAGVSRGRVHQLVVKARRAERERQDSQ